MLSPNEMDTPALLFNPCVSDFSGRLLTMGNSETITFEEAYSKEYLRIQALQFYRNTLNMFPPLEFTQYVLRKAAVNESGCRRFEGKLPVEIRNCLKGLIGRQNKDIIIRRVHASSQYLPNRFRGMFLRLFLKKVIYNLQNEVDRYDYSEHFATIFPFQVLRKVPVRYDIEITKLFDEDFYDQIQTFLNDHFESVDVREITYLFLSNINHFKVTRFSEQVLLMRTHRNVRASNEAGYEDYLSSFPRLNQHGVEWFKNLYDHYKNVCKVFNHVNISLNIYDDDYFRMLPEANFFDLYELLQDHLYESRRKHYIERFKKYLFFFIHALQKNPNPVFFIDDVLFECLKSLRRIKTSREDVAMKRELSMMSLVHLRTKGGIQHFNDCNMYRIDLRILRNIKKYVQNIPNIHNVKIDIEYKTNYLHGWVLFRDHDTCYEVCYSRRDRKHVDNFIDRILCSVLAPDNEPIKYIVFYNIFKGQETKLEMPQDIESIRNFIRLTNTYNFDNQAKSNCEFLTKEVEMYFDGLTVADD